MGTRPLASVSLLLRPLGILVSRPLGFALRCAIYSHFLYFLLDCCCFQFFKRFREGAPWPSVTYITSVFPNPSIDEQFRHTAGVFLRRVTDVRILRTSGLV